MLALGMAGAIFVNKSVVGLQALLPDVSEEAVRNGIAGTSSGFFQTLPEDKQGPALDIIVSAIDDVYILLIVAGAITTIGACFLKVRSFCF